MKHLIKLIFVMIFTSQMVYANQTGRIKFTGIDFYSHITKDLNLVEEIEKKGNTTD